MTFGFPAFFWATLALLPLAAVYFIKTRPRRQPVNAFFLWQQVFKQKASNSLFQRLRNLLSLLLVALAFLAAVFALSSAQQRMTWFKRGLDTGNANQCNTFDGKL